MDSQCYIIPGQRIKPVIDKETARKWVKRLYGLKVRSLEELNSYDDKNYHVFCHEDFENSHITSVERDGYILKIVNSLDSRKSDVIEAQNEAMLYLNRNGIVCSLPVKQTNGLYFSLETLDQGRDSANCSQQTRFESDNVHDYDNSTQRQKVSNGSELYAVKLLVYRAGTILQKVPITEELLIKIGRFTAKLDQVLMGFRHSAYETHKTHWMLVSVPMLNKFIFAIEYPDHRDLVYSVIAAFENQVLRKRELLNEGIIHGDLNEQNILVDDEGKEIRAIIDFGDMHRGCFVFELAIAICYMMLAAQDMNAGKYVLRGYEEMRPLPQIEKNILKMCVCARLCQSLTFGAYSHHLDPQNDYVLNTQKYGWKLLKELWPMNDREISQIWDF